MAVGQCLTKEKIKEYVSLPWVSINQNNFSENGSYSQACTLVSIPTIGFKIGDNLDSKYYYGDTSGNYVFGPYYQSINIPYVSDSQSTSANIEYLWVNDLKIPVMCWKGTATATYSNNKLTFIPNGYKSGAVYGAIIVTKITFV